MNKMLLNATLVADMLDEILKTNFITNLYI